MRYVTGNILWDIIFFVFDYKFFKYWWHFAKKNFLHHAWSLCLNTPCQDIVRVLVIACESFLYCVGNITFENLNGKKVKKKGQKDKSGEGCRSETWNKKITIVTSTWTKCVIH